MFIQRLLLRLLILVVLLCGLLAAPQDNFDYEEEAENVKPPAPVIPAKHTSLLRRGPTNRSNPLNKATTTTTTTPKPVEEEHVEDEEYSDHEGENEAVTSSTEAPVKVRGGFVRPFRSNDDLLAALKRRRTQVTSAKSLTTKAPVPSISEEPKQVVPAKKSQRFESKPSNGRKRFNAVSKPTPAVEEVSEHPSSTQRSSRGRFSSRIPPKVHHGDTEFQGSETNQESVQVPSRTRSYRSRSRT